MITLSFLFKKPESGDKGSTFWPALEDNIQQLNDHTHDGNESARLTGAAVTAVKQNISAAGWVSSGSGYRQLVTMTGGLLYDDYWIIFRDQASGNQPLLLVTEKVSSNTYYVYCNDNTKAITAYYLS